MPARSDMLWKNASWTGQGVRWKGAPRHAMEKCIPDRTRGTLERRAPACYGRATVMKQSQEKTANKEKKIFRAEIIWILALLALILLPQLVGPVKRMKQESY